MRQAYRTSQCPTYLNFLDCFPSNNTATPAAPTAPFAPWQVVSVSPDRRSVVLSLTEGFSQGQPIVYISTGEYGHDAVITPIHEMLLIGVKRAVIRVTLHGETASGGVSSSLAVSASHRQC